MKYYSTNGKAPIADLQKAVVKGLAEDRGLYMPEAIKLLPKVFFDNIQEMNFQQIAYNVASAFFGEDVDLDALQDIVYDTLSFDCPVKQVKENIYALELFHGPTLAFKDDEYLLNFINVEEIGERDSLDVDERVVEQRIVENIKKFIMTFGNDFAFIGNQYHLEVYGVEQFPDLLFFNRELNALVVIELKTGPFKTSYLGQLMGYLSILDAKVKKQHENPSIGIVLCKSADREFVEFVIRDYSKPMGVATYSTSQDMPEPFRNALPDVEELKKLL